MNTTALIKDYSLNVIDRGQYLHVQIDGEHETLEIATAYWAEIAERVIDSGHKKVLVIENIPEMISVAEVHQMVTSLAELPVKDIRVAFVDRFADHSSINDFGVLVSENRGFTVKAFDGEAEAETWLLAA